MLPLLNVQIFLYFQFQGTIIERKPLLLLFSEDAMNTILSAAVLVANFLIS
jgi:hypothetical protein